MVAENAATTIIDWSAAFGVPKALMSDWLSHFKNETIRLVSKGLCVPHHFTLPYCPRSNGLIERLGKELIRTARSVLSELQLRFEEWPDLFPLIQSVINNSPSPQRGNVALVKAFHGAEPTPPISNFYRTAGASVVTLTELQREKSTNVAVLVQKIEELLSAVQKSLEKHRKAGRASTSRDSLPNFVIGDYVLVARSEFYAGEKLALRWRGQRHVVRTVLDYVYTV